jgi:hypothetical protein
MTHPSDPFDLSIYSDTIDQFSTIPSDSFSFEPSEQTTSQVTEPTINQLPSSIQRVGDRAKDWALWTDMTKTEFIEWWLTTQYGSKPEAHRMHWDGKGHTSDVWTHFNQIANIQTGRPKVICKQCGAMFSYPSLNGTTALRRHRANRNCQKNKGKQPNIQHLMQRAVFILNESKEYRTQANIDLLNLGYQFITNTSAFF